MLICFDQFFAIFYPFIAYENQIGLIRGNLRGQDQMSKKNATKSPNSGCLAIKQYCAKCKSVS